MPAVYIPNWVQVTFKGTQAGFQVVNTFNWRYSGAGPLTPADLLAIANACFASFGAQFKAALSSTYNLDVIEARDMAAVGAGVAQVFPAQPQPGAVSGNPEAANVAACISLRTGLSGRSHRGRVFLGPLGQSMLAGSFFTNGFLLILQTFADRLLVGQVTGGRTYTPAVASRRLAALTDIVSYVIDNKADSQRRRLPGRGR